MEQGEKRPSKISDYYERLGVARNSTNEDIHKAWLKLVKRWHPDVNGNKDIANEEMKALNQAYDVLSDYNKRNIYDLGGNPDANVFSRPNNYRNNSTFRDPFRGTSRNPFGEYMDSCARKFYNMPIGRKFTIDLCEKEYKTIMQQVANGQRRYFSDGKVIITRGNLEGDMIGVNVKFEKAFLLYAFAKYSDKIFEDIIKGKKPENPYNQKERFYNYVNEDAKKAEQKQRRAKTLEDIIKDLLF